MSTELRQLSREQMTNGTRLEESPLTIYHLIRKINKGSLLLAEPIEVWSDKRKSEYIESIYLNYPLTPFYSQELDNDKLLLKRGTEKALAIIDYFEGKLKLTGLKRLPTLQNYSLDEIRQKEAWLYDKFTERTVIMYASLSKLSPKENNEAVRRSLWR